MGRIDILISLRFGGEGLKGAIRRTFKEGLIISSTCDNSGFLDNTTNMKIDVVNELTA
jgi:hypothetical protein